MAEQEALQRAAVEASEWFETATRPDGESFTRTKDGAPEWVSDLVYAAHGDFLPDDWRYACIRAAVDWLAEGGDPDESGEFADEQVDVYTGARFEWLSSNLQRQGYCDEAREEFGADPDRDISDQIGLGQYFEASEVFGLVLQELEERAEELEEESEGVEV